MAASLDDVWDDWRNSVNMTARELDKWLDTENSRSVGDKSSGGEAIGHQSGRRVSEILRKPKATLTDDDVEHMRTVVGYVKRHLAQRPNGDIRETRWRYSLMNWGHDPLKS
jgi:hypothetical protein